MLRTSFGRRHTKSVVAGDDVSNAQVDALAAALQVVRESHSELVSDLQAEAGTSGPNNVDVLALCADLEAAVAGFDPGAADIVEQLLGTQEPGSELGQRLSSAKAFLDAFNFSDAEPLLAGLKEDLRA